MRAILHIGHHNTGTPAIAAGLAQNWYKLLQEGMLFPLMDSQSQATSLAQALRPAQPINQSGSHFSDPYGCTHDDLARDLISPQDQPPLKPFQPLKEQIQLIAPQTLILCTARFADLTPQAHAAYEKALQEMLKRAEVHIHLYIQRPDHHLEALFGQWIIQGRPCRTFREEANTLLDSRHVDYRLVLENWRRLFPKAKLHLCAFDPNQNGTQHFKNFCHLFDLPCKQDLSEVICPTPPELPPLALWNAYRKANGVITSHGATALQNTLRQCVASVDLPKDAQIELFGTDTRNHLADAFAPVIADLISLAQDPHDMRHILQTLDDIRRPKPVTIEDLNDTLARSLPGFPMNLRTPGLRNLRRALRQHP